MVAFSLLGQLGFVDVVFSLTHDLDLASLWWKVLKHNSSTKGHKIESIDPSAMNLVTVVHNNDEAVDPTRSSGEADANA